MNNLQKSALLLPIIRSDFSFCCFEERGRDLFNGIYRHSVDTKGRMAIPAKFRSELGDVFSSRSVSTAVSIFFLNPNGKKFNTAIRSTLSFTAAEKAFALF